MALTVVFWMGLTALAVALLGRLKRWLLAVAKKRNRPPVVGG